MSAWHISRNGKIRGPFTDSEVFELIGKRQIEGGDYAQSEDGAAWRPIWTVPGFAASFGPPSAAGYAPPWPQPMTATAAPWYQSTAIGILAILLCWPLGLVLLLANPRASAGLKIGVTAAFGGLLVLGCIAASFAVKQASGARKGASIAAQTEPENIVSEVPDQVSIVHLLGAYKRNEISADNEFKGKWFQTTGTVGTVAKDFLDKPYITVGTGEQFELPPVVQCMLKDGGRAASLSPGQKVTISGMVRGKMMNVLFDDCEIR